MSKADEMFKELGYKKVKSKKRELYSKSEKFGSIEFCKDIGFYHDWEIVSIESDTKESNIDKEELKAIATRAKELGWT